MGLSIIVIKPGGRRLEIAHPTGISWSTHYGAEGGGFGYFTFERDISVQSGAGQLSFGDRIVVVKWLNTIIFDGNLRQIEEESSPDGDKLSYTAIGPAVIASDIDLTRVFWDTRYTAWMPHGEVPYGLFRPDQFATGTTPSGNYLSGNNRQEENLAALSYTQLDYRFKYGELLEGFGCNISMALGFGVIWSGTINTIDTGTSTITYTGTNGETSIQPGMTLINLGAGELVTVETINTGTNTITYDGTASGWGAADEIAISGPFFQAEVLSVIDNVVTYTADSYEANLISSNLQISRLLVNQTQKSTAQVSFTAGPGWAVNTTANTIGVTNASHIAFWEPGDIIYIPAPMFYATLTSHSGTTVNFSNPIGKILVDSTDGWAIFNNPLPTSTDSGATILFWDGGGTSLSVTDAADISGWSNGTYITIYTPFRLQIVDANDTNLWPETDWRVGARPLAGITFENGLLGGVSDGISLKFRNYLTGAGSDSSFGSISNIKITSDPDALIQALPVWAVENGQLPSISTSTALIEDPTTFPFYTPLFSQVYEYTTIKDALSDLATNFNFVWGVELDTSRKLYFKFFDGAEYNQILYQVRRAGSTISHGGDISQSVQIVRGLYQDKKGVDQLTAYIDPLVRYGNQLYRRETIRLDNIDNEDDAVETITNYILPDRLYPVVTSSYEVTDGSITNRAGHPVRFDEIQANGKRIQIEDKRALDGSRDASNLGNGWVIERLMAVEVNYDDKTVTLIPAEAKQTFARYMSFLAKLAGING